MTLLIINDKDRKEIFTKVISIHCDHKEFKIYHHNIVTIFARTAIKIVSLEL